MSNNTPLLLSSRLAHLSKALQCLNVRTHHTSLRAVILHTYTKLNTSSSSTLGLAIARHGHIISLEHGPCTTPKTGHIFHYSFTSIHEGRSSPFTHVGALTCTRGVVRGHHTHNHTISRPLFLGAQNRITRKTISGIFTIVKKSIIAPPISYNLLPKIVHRTIVKFAKTIRHPVVPSRLLQTSRIFLAGSLVNTVPITNVNNIRFRPKDISHSIGSACTHVITQAQTQTRAGRFQ